jgi:hypothetical protein
MEAERTTAVFNLLRLLEKLGIDKAKLGFIRWWLCEEYTRRHTIAAETLSEN